MAPEAIDSIGSRIAQYRKMNGMSAEDLARECGDVLTRSVITNIENGRKADVTVTQLLAIASALGVPPVALVFDLNNPDKVYSVRDGANNRDLMKVWGAIDWFGGNITATKGMKIAGRRVDHVLGHLRNYKRKTWQLAALTNLLVEAEAGANDPQAIEQYRREVERLHLEIESIESFLDAIGIDQDSPNTPRSMWWKWGQ